MQKINIIDTVNTFLLQLSKNIYYVSMVVTVNNVQFWLRVYKSAVQCVTSISYCYLHYLCSYSASELIYLNNFPIKLRLQKENLFGNILKSVERRKKKNDYFSFMKINRQKVCLSYLLNEKITRY